MKTSRISYVSWLSASLAFVAWAGVGFFAWSISEADSARASAEVSVGEKATEVDTTLRLHALARETKDLRATLESLTHIDVVSIVETIEAVGKDTHVALEINQVVADHPLPAASPEAPPIRPVTVALEAQGTFEALLHTAALLHSLPVPSTVEQMQFEHLPVGADTKKGLWRFSARIRVLTTAAISS